MYKFIECKNICEDYISNTNFIDIAIMESNGKGYGRLVWYEDEPTVAYLDSMSVGIDNRNKGLGTELQSFRENIARNNGCTTIKLLVKNDSWMHEWYKRRGYTDINVHDVYTDYMWMEKQL